MRDVGAFALLENGKLAASPYIPSAASPDSTNNNPDVLELTAVCTVPHNIEEFELR